MTLVDLGFREGPSRGTAGPLAHSVATLPRQPQDDKFWEGPAAAFKSSFGARGARAARRGQDALTTAGETPALQSGGSRARGPRHTDSYTANNYFFVH